MDSSHDDNLIGKSLGPYRIESRLGEGGMGEVYRALHVNLERPVAIKTLRPEVAANRDMLERFFAEARATNLIRHENIIECTDLVREPNGRSYIVMELLEGRTLSQAIRDSGRIEARRTVIIAAQAADALYAAHQKGIVHRDLKPDNIFLIRRMGSDDYVKVLDFGVASLMPNLGEVRKTATGAIIGTPAYMSPEQVMGQKVTPAADIYALGVILFHMLTGRLPFDGATLPVMMMAHVSEAPPSLAELAPSIPAALVDIVARALAKEPAARIPDMGTMRTALLASVGMKDIALPESKIETVPYGPGNSPFDHGSTYGMDQRAPATADTGGTVVGVPTAQTGPQPSRRTQTRVKVAQQTGPRVGPQTTSQTGPQSNQQTGPQSNPQPVGHHSAPSNPSTHAANAALAQEISQATTPPEETRRLGRPIARPAVPSQPHPAAIDAGIDTAGVGSSDFHDQSAVERPPTDTAGNIDHTGNADTAGNTGNTDRDDRRPGRLPWILVALASVSLAAIAAWATISFRSQSSDGGATDQVVEHGIGQHGVQIDANVFATDESDRSTASAEEARALRQRFDRVRSPHREPAAPSACQSQMPEVLHRLTRTAELLIDGAPDGQRPQDLEAVRILSATTSTEAEHWYWLAKARLFAKSEASMVVDAARRALELCDKYAAPYNVIGSALFRDDPEKAIAAYRNALNIDASFAIARYNLALALLQQGQVRESLTALDEVLSTQPDDTDALLARGQAHLMARQSKQAVTDLERVIASDPERAIAHWLLSQAYKRVDRDRDARDALCRAGELGHEQAAEMCSERL